MSRTIDQLNGLRTAVVDSCSVIYMKRAGFFDRLAQDVALVTVPQVIRETGFQDLKITICPSSGDGLSVDRQLVDCAVRRACPIISEDKKVLLAARREGLDFFNALVMAHFLLLRGSVSDQEHRRYCAALSAAARYGPEVLKIGDNIHRQVNAARKESYYGKR